MTGCLRGGTYGGFSVQTNITRGGTSAARVTITSFPGERATVQGFVYVAPSAPFVTVSNIAFQGNNNFWPSAGGTGAQPLIVDADDFILEDSDYSNANSGNGVLLREGARAIVRRNRIHDVGSNSAYDHGIYISHAKDFQVLNNWIYDCRAGWGIHLYSDADRGVIRGNVIDGCGAGITFSAYNAEASQDNLFEHNIVSNSLGHANNPGFALSGWFNSAVPTGNVARDNVFYNNAAGSYDETLGTSYAASRNVVSNPLYVNRAAKDFRLSPGSPAAAYGIWDGVYGQDPPTNPPPPHAAGCAVSTSRGARYRGAQGWQFDLGRACSASQAGLRWNASRPARYRLLTSTDRRTWTGAADDSIRRGGWRTTTFASRSARYMRIVMLRRPRGLSLLQVRVSGN
jgi:hypothetical protein